MHRLYLHILFLLFAPCRCLAQDLNYIHYDTKDGLAGSTVYDISQDKDGFIWFATENGLSRFDGKNFKNFTVKDGLPDNEILRVYTDSKGRVWIMPFRKAISYYYNNKIYNKENDSLLHKINPESHIFEIDEDQEKNIVLGDAKKAIFVGNDGVVKDIFTPRSYKGEVPVSARKNYFGKGFLIRFGDSAFYYRNNKLVFAHLDPIVNDRTTVPLVMYENGQVHWLKIPHAYITYQTNQNYVNYINTYNGCFATDTVNKSIATHYLRGKKVSKALEDSEGNLWFSTFGEGVYKLSSKETKTMNFTQHKIANPEVFSLTKHNNNLVCGLGFSKAVLLRNNRINTILNFENYTHYLKEVSITNRLYCSKTLTTGVTLLGFDSYLVKLENNKPVFKDIFPVKSVEEINKDFIIAGTSNHIFRIRVSDLHITDTIWKGRCTKVFYNQNNYYIGTINGLYEMQEDKTYTYLGDLHPALKRRITDIKSGPDQTLFIATADEGVVVYRNGKITASITEQNGLSSNICRTLFLHHDFLFIGTDKGLNKYDISGNNLSILKYSVSDGLPSDNINAVYAEDSTIWVGSSAGLTWFNEKKLSSLSMCNVTMLSMIVSGKVLEPRLRQRLSHIDNNITFEYAGISFKSGGDMEYHYKLDGLDKGWNKTQQNSLIYQSLPSGNYEFQLYAVNKFGVKSEIIKVGFSIITPFWKKWWFYGVLFAGVMALTVWLVNKRYRRIQVSREEQNKIQQQFAALEQQALQAQMNPHFIFNCLNSIQQYILTNDKEKANQYLTGFALLVRQTLDSSGRRTITLAEEIAYLRKYLQMEEMRFANNFSYEILVDEAINTDFTEIPALLLQPYVENSLRHGIRYKENGSGKVSISFLMEKDVLHCGIKDNGVGREKAAEFRSRQHIEYQSRGMMLTEKRINLLNKINKSRVMVEIVDLKDDNGSAAGTEVVVKIPLNNHE